MPLQLQSLVRPDGQLQLSLADVPQPQPVHPDDVVIRVEAAPVNPSDLGNLLAGADVQQATRAGSAERPVVTAPLSPAALAANQRRAGTPLPVGNEGAGMVVAAGSAPAAQALLGRHVAALAGGGMYGEFQVAPAALCLALPDGATAAQGASSFINPLTALGMVETMRQCGHSSLLHTAAASNLGQMLNRICLKDGIPLVNLVRRADQAALLRGQDAQHVLDTSVADFPAQLVDTLAATDTRLLFDATGGGTLIAQVLAAMEAALLRRPGLPYSRYGSQIHKQAYVYGFLQRGAIELPPGFGFSWSLSGWLLFPFMQQLAPERLAALKQRVADELTSTFASHYEREASLAELLTPEALQYCARMGTGQKLLVRPAPG